MTQRFAELYGIAPDGIWAAPGRLNLIGEFTDYNGGFVLPMALEQVTTASVARRSDQRLLIHSADVDDGAAPLSFDLATLAPGGARSWSDYAVGVAWALQQAGHQLAGLDVLVESRVPIGAGLSSSAALECAIGLAFRDLFAPSLSLQSLALICQRAENLFVGVPSGIMDQTASLCCTKGHAIVFDTRSGAIEQLPFDLETDGLELLVIDTRVRHQLASSAYAERRAACERAATAIGVPMLRDATLSDLEQIADPTDRRRARHVITEDARVLKIAALLKDGAYEAVGPVLTEAHRSLREDFEVTCPELDTAADQAVEAGAFGARMIGGGFGGCVVALIRTSERDRVQYAIEQAFADQGFTQPSCFTALPAAGARRIA